MLTLNDYFREITSHMAVLSDEIRDITHQLHGELDEKQRISFLGRLKSKRELRASLKDELLQLGAVEQASAHPRLSHRRVHGDFSAGCGDGEYYLDND